MCFNCSLNFTVLCSLPPPLLPCRAAVLSAPEFDLKLAGAAAANPIQKHKSIHNSSSPSFQSAGNPITVVASIPCAVSASSQLNHRRSSSLLRRHGSPANPAPLQFPEPSPQLSRASKFTAPPAFHCRAAQYTSLHRSCSHSRSLFLFDARAEAEAKKKLIKMRS